jgi:hypothetical protein
LESDEDSEQTVDASIDGWVVGHFETPCGSFTTDGGEDQRWVVPPEGGIPEFWSESNQQKPTGHTFKLDWWCCPLDNQEAFAFAEPNAGDVKGKNDSR